jgi:clan AA aspartic protease
MGEVRINITIKNHEDILLADRNIIGNNEIRSVTLDALVDTGAVMTLLPQDAVEALGLRNVDKVIVALANDQKIEMGVTNSILIEVGKRRMVTDALIGPPQCEALIGQLVLERLDLVIDPLNKTLTPRPESPFLPSLKMK